jgi:hypothetical protein
MTSNNAAPSLPSAPTAPTAIAPSSTKDNDKQPPTSSITVIKQPNGGSLPLPPVEDTFHRAVHKIRLSALSHNYSEVESAANQQRCSVIVVVKADGYGHGAIATALYLADNMGADAFAVATFRLPPFDEPTVGRLLPRPP